MKAMDEILIVCNRYPLPENSGTNIRTMNFVRYFRQNGLVDMCCNGGDRNDRRNGFRTMIASRKKSYPKNAVRRLACLFTGAPYPITGYDGGTETAIREWMRVKTSGFILVRYMINAASFLAYGADVKKRIIIDVDDVLTDTLYDTYYDKGGGRARDLLRKINKAALMRYERRCGEFGAVLLCAGKDKTALKLEGRKNVFVVPNVYGNDTFDGYNFGDGKAHRGSLLFVGNLSYEPNVDGLKWFIKDVWRELVGRDSTMRLTVVGKSPAEEIARLCACEKGVELHADAPDLRPYYRESYAVVVPLLSGGGTRIKILEAATAGRPVISTRIGAEGLDLEDGRELMVFEDKNEFIQKYRMLGDRSSYDRMTGRAKAAVEAAYSGDVFNRAMDTVMDHMQRTRCTGN